MAGPIMVTFFSSAVLMSFLVWFSGMPSAMIAIVWNCVRVCTCACLIEVYTKGIGVVKDCQSHTIHVSKIVYHMQCLYIMFKNAQSLHYFNSSGNYSTAETKE